METKKASSYFLVGILLCVLGSICFSSKAIFVKMAYRDTPVDAVTLLALRLQLSPRKNETMSSLQVSNG